MSIEEEEEEKKLIMTNSISSLFFSLSLLRLLNNEHMALYTSCSYRYLIKGAY